MPEKTAPPTSCTRDAALARLSRELLASDRLDDMAAKVLASALEMTASPWGFAGHIDEAGGGLVVPAAVPASCALSPEGTPVHLAFEAHSGLWGQGLEDHRSLVVNNAREDELASHLPPEHVRLERLALVPALAGGELMGMVAVANAENDYTDADVAVLEQLAELYALGVRQARANRNLVQARDFSSDLLDTAGALIVVMNAQGQIVRFNRACTETTGYLEEEVLGRVFWDFLVLPEDLGPVREVFLKLKAGDFPSSYTNHWVSKDGEERLIAWTNTVRLDAAGKVEYVLGTGIDITEQERAEAASREHHSLLSAITDTMPNPVFYKDLKGRYQGFNKAFEDMLGLSREDILGKTVYDIAPSDLARIYHEKDLELMARGGDQTYEAMVRWADGRRHDVIFSKRVRMDPEGEPCGMVGVVQDVSEIKRSQQDLAGLVSLLSSVIEATGDGIYAVNLDGEVLKANERFRQMWGMERSQMDAASDEDVVDHMLERVRDRETFMLMLHDHLRNPGTALADEVELQDGRIFERVLRPQVQGREVVGRVWSFRDVTRARERERQITLFKHFTDLGTQGFGIATLAGRVHYANPVLARMCGMDDPSEAQDLMIVDCYTEESRRIVETEVFPALSARGSWTGELAIKGIDGRTTPTLEHFFIILSDDGEPEFIGDVLTDMTEMKAAQAELEAYREHLETLVQERTRDLREANLQLAREMEERVRAEREFRGIFENSIEGIYRSSLDGTLMVANPSIMRMFGFDSMEDARAEVNNIRNLYADPSRRDEFLAALMEKGFVEGFENELVSRDGRRFWASVTSRLVTGEDGEPLYIEGMLSDITARKLADEDILKFKALAENSSDFIGMADMDGKVAYLNPAGCAMVGLPGPDKAVGLGIEEFSHQGVVIRERALPQVRAAGQWRGEGSLKNFETGEPVPVDIDVFVVRRPGDGRPLCLAAIMRDIRELRLAREELARREALTRALMNAISETVFLIDTDGVILAANKTMADRLGMAVDELVGENIRTFIPEDALAFREAKAMEAISQGREVRFQDERDGRVLDQTIYPVPGPDGEVEALAVFGRDVTEERRALEQLRVSEQRFRTAVIDAPYPVVIHAEDGQALMISRRWTELSGYVREDLPTLEHWLEKQLPADRREEVREKITALFSLDERHDDGEFEFRAKNGKRLVWEFSSAPLGELPDGRRLVISMANDVTERNRVARELARSNEELQQFAYVASHDLQEPLRMVRSFMELLDRRYGDRLDSKAKSYVGYAMDGAVRMQGLIEDLLALSRVRTKGRPFARVEPCLVLKEVLGDLKFLVRESKAEVECVPMPPVMADATQVRQLFQNLLSNAIKFRSEAPPRVRVSAEPGEGFVEFAVRDNGVGVRPGDHERAFKVFQRMHSREDIPGSGMGLAICKRIVERHGGRIWMESEPGQGTNVFFTLPATDENGEPS